MNMYCQEKTGGVSLPQQEEHEATCRTRLRPAGSRAWRMVLPLLMLLGVWFHYTSAWHRIPHCSRSESSIVDKVLRHTPLLDGHNDFPILIRFLYQNHLNWGNITKDAKLPQHVDFPRLRKGRVGAQYWSVWVNCPETPIASAYVDGDEDRFPNELYNGVVGNTLQQIDLVHRMTQVFPENMVAASSYKDVMSNYRNSPHRISSLIGVEGLHQIANSPSVLRMYHSVGVRYVTLTHVCHNRYADSASLEPYWKGLSKEGEAMVREMNRIGMVVDLAHTSPDTMRHTLDITDVPLMFSHSSAYAICPHPRNVPDDVLWKLKRNGGVVMITFLNDYVNCKNPDNATLSDVADHIQHVGELIGYEHVGIGSDFDGMLTQPIGLEDVSKYPDLLQELAARGLSVDELRGIAGDNALRVLHDVEAASKRMTDVPALEDDIVIKMPENVY